jgi:hypothetical protein
MNAFVSCTPSARKYSARQIVEFTVIELAVMSTASMRLANHIFPLGQWTTLFGNPVRFGKRAAA